MGQLGSHVKHGANRPPSAAAMPLADDGFVEFLLAGTAARGDFRCTDCGYGAVIQRALPLCPMCGGEIWESRRGSATRFAD